MPTRRSPIASIVGVIAAMSCTVVMAADQEAIKREIAGMNESLPAMVSPVLREEPIRFNGAQLQYTFTRVGGRTDATAGQQQTAIAKSYLLTRLCGDPDTRAMMQDGLVFSFAYIDDGAAQGDPMLLNESDCAVLRR